jgi:hypothetical protein
VEYGARMDKLIEEVKQETSDQGHDGSGSEV